MLHFLATVALCIVAAILVIGTVALMCWLVVLPCRLLLNAGVWLDSDSASQRPTKPIVVFSRATWAWLVPSWRNAL